MGLLEALDQVIGCMELGEVRLMLPAFKGGKKVLLQEDLGHLRMHAHTMEMRDAHVAQRERCHTRENWQMPNMLERLMLERGFGVLGQRHPKRKSPRIRVHTFRRVCTQRIDLGWRGAAAVDAPGRTAGAGTARLPGLAPNRLLLLVVLTQLGRILFIVPPPLVLTGW